MARPKPQDSAASARAREAAYIRHSRGDTKEATKPAREAFLKRFEDEVDPDGKLDLAEREKRANRLLKAHMSKLARKSAAARRRG